MAKNNDTASVLAFEKKIGALRWLFVWHKLGYQR